MGKEIKELGKKKGLKSEHTKSAKQVIRKIDPAKAGSMSLTDDLSSKNKDKALEEIFQVSKLSIPLFEAILNSGLKHNLKELQV